MTDKTLFPAQALRHTGLHEPRHLRQRQLFAQQQQPVKMVRHHSEREGVRKPLVMHLAEDVHDNEPMV